MLIFGLRDFAEAKRTIAPGSIIVFHDSEKAFLKIQYIIPKILMFFSEKGYVFDAIKGIDEDSQL